MVRAVFFDFYSVWAPDKFNELVDLAAQQGEGLDWWAKDVLEKYFHGESEIHDVTQAFRYKLSRMDITDSDYLLPPGSVSSGLTDFLRNLHAHFVKVGVLANLGKQEYELLKRFNEQNELLEVIAGPLPLGLPTTLLSEDVFSAALNAIGEPPEASLVVSGNAEYLNFAANFGMQTIPFEGFPKLQQDLLALIDSEIPKAQ